MNYVEYCSFRAHHCKTLLPGQYVNKRSSRPAVLCPIWTRQAFSPARTVVPFSPSVCTLARDPSPTHQSPRKRAGTWVLQAFPASLYYAWHIGMVNLFLACHSHVQTLPQGMLSPWVPQYVWACLCLRLHSEVANALQRWSWDSVLSPR